MANEVFVFGSNLAGRHGAGAALHAKKYYGAKYGHGIGLQGNSYAIPTKDDNLNTLPLLYIGLKVTEFLDFARKNKQIKFIVTRIGCGLAGYTNKQIAPMFKNAPENCILDEEWIKILTRL